MENKENPNQNDSNEFQNKFKEDNLYSYVEKEEEKAQPQKKKQTKAEKQKKPFKPKVFRLILGVIVGYLVPCIALLISVLALGFNQGAFGMPRWINVILMVITLLIAFTALFYFYGWLHRSMYVLKESHSIWTRIFGHFIGGIGFILHPIVLYAYGPNKKWLYFFIVGLPSLIITALSLLVYFGVIPLTGAFNLGKVEIDLQKCSLYVAIAFFLNFGFAILTRRCPNCGCMMTRIEHGIKDIQWQAYDRYDGIDVNGDNVSIGKYYICEHCRMIKKGIGFSVQTDKIVTTDDD